MRNSRGQSLVEVALMLPLMLIVIMNALNLGYFFFVTVNLTAAARAGIEYSIMGPGAPGTTNYPCAASSATGCSAPYVSTLIYYDMTGAIQNAANATVQICSPSILRGTPPTGTAGGLANCIKCTNSTTCAAATTGANATFVPDADPNAAFVLNRVDIQYTFSPLIPGGLFNLMRIAAVYNSSTGQYTFYRHVEMRAN